MPNKLFMQHMLIHPRQQVPCSCSLYQGLTLSSFHRVVQQHMHHGYYIPADRTDHQQAQIDLIDEVLKWAGVDSAKNMVDVGCGIGGSSRHIAKKFGCTAQGVTLSPYQAGRGNELAKEQGLDGQTTFQVRIQFECVPFCV